MAFVDFLFDDEKLASSQKHTPNISMLECKNYSHLWPKSAKIDPLFMTKTVQKPYPSGSTPGGLTQIKNDELVKFRLNF